MDDVRFGSCAGRRRADGMWLVALVAAGCIVWTACGSAQHVDDEDDFSDVPVSEVYLDTTVIEAHRTPEGEFEVSSWTILERFRESTEALRDGEYERALDGYDSLMRSVEEDDELERMTHYNRALALEGLGRLDEALDAYAHVRERWRASREANYSYYRSAGVLWDLGRYQHVPPLMDEVLRRRDLTPEDRMEAHLRAANAWLEMHFFEEAEQHLRNTLQSWEGLSAERARNADERVAYRMGTMRAEAYYQRGRISHELALRVPMLLPQERMRDALVEKAEHLDAARESYREAMVSGHPFWAAAAGYRIGRTFEDLYLDILASEIPRDYGELHMEVYFEELRQSLSPFLNQAVRVYEAGYAMAVRINAVDEWQDRLLDAVERVRAYRDEQQGWDAEEQLIIEQMHPRSPGFGRQLQFRLDLDGEEDV